MTGPLVSVTKTSELTPDGVAGYRKSLGPFLAVVIAGVASAWADGSITGAEWGNIGILAASAAVTAFLLPNAVKEVKVATPPTPIDNLDIGPDTPIEPPVVDPPGQHAVDNPDRLRKG